MNDAPQIPHLEAYTTPDDHTTVVGSLDLSTEADRKTLRRSIATANPEHKVQRWGGLDDNLRKQAVKAQAYALKLATERGSVREIDSCVRTLAMLEGQQQADEHLEIKLNSDNDNDRNSVIRRVQNHLTPSTMAKLAELAEEASGKLGDA